MFENLLFDFSMWMGFQINMLGWWLKPSDSLVKLIHLWLSMWAEDAESIHGFSLESQLSNGARRTRSIHREPSTWKNFPFANLNFRVEKIGVLTVVGRGGGSGGTGQFAPVETSTSTSIRLKMWKPPRSRHIWRAIVILPKDEDFEGLSHWCCVFLFPHVNSPLS